MINFFAKFYDIFTCKRPRPQPRLVGDSLMSKKNDLKYSSIKDFKNELDRLGTEALNKAFNGDFPKLNAVKHDKEKPDLSMVPMEYVSAAARAFQFGATKYQKDNWRQGLQWNRLVAALLRHIYQFNEVVEKDEESGLSHLDHAAACLAMLIEHTKKNLGKDTRYKYPFVYEIFENDDEGE